MGNIIVKRRLLDQVAAHLKEPEITVILGPRQVGKTTLVFQLQDWLKEKEHISHQDIFYFNLDVVTDQAVFKDQTTLIEFIRNRAYGNNRLYLFVDEAQRVPDAGRFFKGIYDLGLPVKIVLTGSSSLEIRARIHEPLTGRKRVFYASPFSFSEYVSLKESSLTPFITRPDVYAGKKLLQHLFQFILFGGYPKVVSEKEVAQKAIHLEEIFTSYIEKDVVSFLRIQNMYAFTGLVKILAQETGGLFNVEKTSNELGIKNQTLQQYTKTLEETFVLLRVHPYFHSSRAEIRKMPKMYFYDTGVRNFALEGREIANKPFQERQDKGILLENFIADEVRQTGASKVCFWRTKDGAEVDFVIQKGGNLVPIEVKSSGLKSPLISRSFSSFINKYHPKIGIMVNLSLQQTRMIEGTQMHYILPYELSGILKDL